jgi:NtrC-family two-component system sensor histidine kinase KinB
MRIRRLADHLLSAARAETAAITLHLVPIVLRQVIRELVTEFVAQAEQQRVVLGMDVGEDTVTIRADPPKISWVISNLMANALRCTPPGGSIFISTKYTDCGIRVQVCGTGSELSSPIRADIFEGHMFSHASSSDPVGRELAIAKDIVEAHGGRIYLDSIEGPGISFTLEFLANQEA